MACRQLPRTARPACSTTMLEEKQPACQPSTIVFYLFAFNLLTSWGAPRQQATSCNSRSTSRWLRHTAKCWHHFCFYMQLLVWEKYFKNNSLILFNKFLLCFMSNLFFFQCTGFLIPYRGTQGILVLLLQAFS